MPLELPTIDNRRYRELLDEALARIPAHTPEYTNFNESDPGVTLIEVFAFLTESLLYRSNQIPDRNRRKFLQLLGLPLAPASPARGIVTFNNTIASLEGRLPETVTLNSGLEVTAGEIPFRTTQGLDVPPIEARLFYKRRVAHTARQLDYYNQLYASFSLDPLAPGVELYETVPFPQSGAAGLDLGAETIDGALWIALLVRAADRPTPDNEDEREKLREAARERLGGRTLNLGVVPMLAEASRRLTPGGQANPEAAPLLTYEIPIAEDLPESGERLPRYRPLPTITRNDVLAEPGLVQITLPAKEKLRLWKNLEPLEPGVGAFPPSLEDTGLNNRLITWIRVRAIGNARARLLWAGINATTVSQRAEVVNETLPSGTGAPDQVITLSRRPVIPGSVKLFVTTGSAPADEWSEIDDLTAAGPEVPVADPRQSPGSQAPPNDRVKVFRLDAEAGRLYFGDGFRGARLPLDARLRASYAYAAGRKGNVNIGAINAIPALPAGFKVTNQVPTWGGADAETVGEGEKQITRYLQHRDRLVNQADFETITRRTPGVEIGRVVALTAYNPELGGSEPGDAPGAVTLMVIPRYDPVRPDAPLPDQLFLNAICDYLDQRRLVTTELFLRGPDYRDIWVSVGINVVAGSSVAEVTEAVKRRLKRALSPLPLDPTDSTEDPHPGWPLRKPVLSLELMAIASRVSGVMLVSQLLLSEGAPESVAQIEMRGLELPRIVGISVTVGSAIPLSQLIGAGGETGGDTRPPVIPVPIIPEECQ